LREAGRGVEEGLAMACRATGVIAGMIVKKRLSRSLLLQMADVLEEAAARIRKAISP
jgi:hypothetical protein